MLVHNSSNYMPKKKDNVCQMILAIILLATVSLLLNKGLAHEIILFKNFG